MKNENEDTEREVSQELCSNDRLGSGDSRNLEESVPFETVPFVNSPNSSGDSESLEELDPNICVEKLGHGMQTLFSNWSKEFIPSKAWEENTLKRLDDLKNEAYTLEVQYLESKLEMVKKRITKS